MALRERGVRSVQSVNASCEAGSPSLADQHHLRKRERLGMRDCQVRSPDAHALGLSSCATVEEQPRWTADANDLDVLPEHAARPPGAQRFHRRFFGRKPSGQVRRGIPPARTIGNLAGCKHALQKALTVALEDRGQPGNVGRVQADAEDIHA